MRRAVRRGLCAWVAAGLAAWAAEVCAAQAGARVDRILPVDQAARDPALFAFRARVATAVAARDTATLLAATAPDVMLSFGGDIGRDLMLSWLRDPVSHGRDLWVELGAALALGGTFRDDTLFVAPYTFTTFPRSRDSWEDLVVIDGGVRVRSAPDPAARVLATLAFEVVAAPADTSGGDWARVRLRDGRTGYVARRFVRSPIDCRASFERRGGRWWLTSLVAGD